MIASEIITKFELFMDDTTDLSSTEELDLLNKIYTRVCMDRPWEFLKKAFTGTTSGTLTYISLPSDFAYLTQNANYTDSSYSASRPVIFVGSMFSPYQVVSWSDRRQYRDQIGYCYIDIVNSRLYFTFQPEEGLAVEFDYSSVPTALTLSDTPLIPSRFHDMLYHGMCVEDNIIQQSDKAKSYAQENQQKYKSYFDDMCYWNSNLIQI
tara:strand:- start:8 stop:631 length:624 start_codon:yes stop_codon:yes gene_type:complete